MHAGGYERSESDRPLEALINRLKTLLAFRRDPIRFFQELAAKGDSVPYVLGRQPMLFLNHPDLAREMMVTRQSSFSKGRVLERAKAQLLGDGLLTSQGAVHRRSRRMMQPLFHIERLRGYSEVMVRAAEKLSASLSSGVEFDANTTMQRLALEIVGEALFGVDLTRDSSEIGRAVRDVMHRFRLLPSPLELVVERLKLPSRIVAARARLDRILFQMIEERRKEAEDRSDLLSMLIVASEEEGFDDQQVRDEAMTLLLAGHETTALALAWAIQALSAEPELQRNLRKETLAVDRLGWDALKHLPLLGQTFDEVLRLYPPAWAIGRRALEPVEIGGRRVETGTVVVTSQFLIQRDPRFWEEPLVFKPQRWNVASRKEAREAFRFFPFGAGARQCIGEHFAWAEGVLVLAALLRRWQFRVARPAGFRALLTLHPSEPIRAIPG